MRVAPLVAALALLVAGAAAVDWEGVWGDACDDDSCYGGLLYTCTSRDTLYGLYSDIGFVLGEVEDDEVRGVWYEAGFELDNHGNFRWEVAGDDDDDVPGFNGAWTADDFPCIREAWAAPLLSDDDPSQESCAAIADDDDDGMSGTWVSDAGEVLSLCLWKRQPYFYGTAAFPSSNDTVSFFTGVAHQGFKVGQASTVSLTGQGIGLLVLINSDRLLVTRWSVASSVEARGRFDEDGLHEVEIFQRVSEDDDEDSCAFAASLAAGWEGTFSDPRHGEGRFSVCNVGGNRVQGIFSELGWIDGAVDPTDSRVLAGTWQQAGDDEDDAGTFALRLDELGLAYAGYYTRGDDDDQHPWGGVRLSAVAASAQEQCWATVGNAPGASVGGIWSYGTSGSDVFDVCVSAEGKTQVSYAYNGGTVHGYGLGKTSSDEQSMRIQWREEEAGGIAIYRLLDQNTLLESLWALETSADDIDILFCDDDQLNYQYYGLHAVNRLTRISTVMDGDRCDRFDSLVSVDPSRSSYERAASPPPSSAASLAVSWLSVALVAMMFL